MLTTQNKKAQAVIEYVLVLAVFVLVSVYGFNILKCNLHKIWIKTACDILYPYPAEKAQDLEDYCTPISPCI